MNGTAATGAAGMAGTGGGGPVGSGVDGTVGTAAAGGGDGGTAAGRAAVAPVLETLGGTGRVRITGGRLAGLVEKTVETYLGLDPDDVLHGFRAAAGLPAPGRPMTGWAERTSHMTFGQWVSGLARLGAAHGVPEATERAVRLVDGWAATRGADGDAHMELYAFEKLVCGLVDTARYAGYGDALDVLADVSGWAARTFDRSRAAATAADFVGGPDAVGEWYTLAENLYRGFLAGGDPALRDLARVWHYDAYWSRFERRPEPGQDWDVPAWLHAYSHVNTFASAAAAYEVTGDPHLLDVVRNGYDFVTTTQAYATGGYGPGELLLPRDGTLGRALEWRTDSAEITCGSWAAFKISVALLRHTGEARYGDWAERLVHSGVGATPPVEADGRTPYYHDYRLGTATKLYHWEHWPCCSGTYVQCIAALPDLVYLRGADELAVNLFVPSTIELEVGGTTVHVVQETAFPESDTTRLRVTADAPVTATVKVRVPAWSSGLTIDVDGEAVDARPSATGWAEVRRTWSGTSTVTVRLGAGLRLEPVDAWHPNRVALVHGPVVLAQSADWTAPLSLPTPWEMVDLTTALRQEAPLVYRPAGPGTARLAPGVFAPLSDVPARVPYRVYTDLDRPRLV